MRDKIKNLCHTVHLWHEEVKTFGPKTALTKEDIDQLKDLIEKIQEADELLNVQIRGAQMFIDKERC